MKNPVRGGIMQRLPSLPPMAEPLFNAYTAMGGQFRQWLRNHARLRQAPEGSVLVREGVQDNVLFLVEQGSVRVRTTTPGEPATLARLFFAGLIVAGILGLKLVSVQ